MVNDMQRNDIHRLLSPNLGDNFVTGPDSFSYTPEEFNKCLNPVQGHSKLYYPTSILHINCRSISKNYDAICTLLDSIDVQFSAIGLSEI